jgi:peptidoglycan/LPS O-acetylase OafA/YrhL
MSIACPPPKRYVAMDGLRGLTALAVMLFHFTSFSGDGTSPLFPAAPLAVDVFFCLSGFVITHAYAQRLQNGMSFAAFMQQRLRRFYPAYCISCAVGLVALLLKYAGGATSLSLLGVLNAALFNMVFLPYPHEHIERIFDLAITSVLFPLNFSAWSLFLELCVNGCFYYMSRKNIAVLVVIIFVSALLFYAATSAYGQAPGWSLATGLGGFPRVLYGFFMGVIIHKYRHNTSPSPRLSMAWVRIIQKLAFPGCALITILMLSVPHNDLYWLLSALLAVPSIVALSTYAVLPPNGWQERMARYFGALSYPLYRIHAPILLLVSIVPIAQTQQSGLLGAGIALACVLAHLIHYHVERPLQRRWQPQTFSSTGAQS